MKKIVWLSSILFLLFLVSGCDKKIKEENARLKEQVESLQRENAEYTAEAMTPIMMAAPKNPHKIPFKWRYKKVYRLCYTANIGRTKGISIIIHRKNNTVVREIKLFSSSAVPNQDADPNFIFLPFDAYISVQGLDAQGNVIDFTITPGVDVCPPTQAQRDNVNAADNGSGSTVAVTIDELQ